jgi:tetratricopeptide (TPR) repeat protein
MFRMRSLVFSAPPLPRAAVAAVLSAILVAGAARAQDGVSGPYLAARLAMGQSDFPAASEALARAIPADPANLQLIDAAVSAALGEGDIARASEIARSLRAAGAFSQPAALAIFADDLMRADYPALRTALGSGGVAGPLGDGLLLGWIRVGEGDMAAAISALEEAGRLQGAEVIASYTLALARAAAGDFEAAHALLLGPAAPIVQDRRGVLLRVEILAQLDQTEAAIALIDSSFDGPPDPQIVALRAMLAAGEVPSYSFPQDARTGIAEVFHTLSLALNDEQSRPLALAYGRIAVHLDPRHAHAALHVAGMLEDLGQWDLAGEAYDGVAPENPLYVAARIGKAGALVELGDDAAARAALTELAQTHAAYAEVHVALADLLRRAEEYVGAAEAYGRAIAIIGPPLPRHWTLYYSRAIAYERAKMWDLAEPDFRLALQLSPDQPMVLNYLGYSFLEMGTNLDEAMALIRRAVDQRPDSGHIVDSLAWGYFLLGEYEAALVPMERASLLMPVDPIVTDHLGDVYWAVGRKREAEFQWRRALSFDPEPELAERIRRKLEIGLDATLAEEGAPSLADRARR